MMLKGIQKQMIMLKIKESPLFETAYLVMRNDVKSETVQKGDILSEANKIVEGICKTSLERKRELKKQKVKRAFLFVAGVVLGAIFGGVMWLLFSV